MKLIKTFILFFTIIFFSFNTVFSEEYLIASFNTLRLGQNKKDFARMAQILNNFPLIGLVEVMNQQGVEELVDALEKESKEKWDYLISPYSVGTDSYKEFYAFVWKTSTVSLIEEAGFFNDSSDLFIRPPFGATFKIQNFDFTLVLMHSIYGKNKSYRQAEAFYLNEVYEYFQNLDPNENDVIIAGDFNLTANNKSFSPLTIKNKDKVIYALDPSLLTTIGAKNLVNSYDNMFLSKIYTEEFTGVSGVYDFTNNHFEYAKKLISDHLPIFIEVSCGGNDDD
ncbi:MAG: endonuclease/exonuclease/phosphatase family protein [Fusobacteriaceae bacterium]